MNLCEGKLEKRAWKTLCGLLMLVLYKVDQTKKEMSYGSKAVFIETAIITQLCESEHASLLPYM